MRPYPPTVNEALRHAALLTSDLATLPTVKALSVANAAETATAMRHRLARISEFVDDMERIARLVAQSRPEAAPPSQEPIQ